MPKQKVALTVSQALIDPLPSPQDSVNPFLDYELEELLKIPVIVKDNGEEPELSEIQKIQALPSPASGDESAQAGQSAIFDSGPDNVETANRHLSQEFSFEQIYQYEKLPIVASTSRDLGDYSNLQPVIHSDYHENVLLILDNTLVETTNVDEPDICRSDITTFLDSLDTQDNQLSLREAIINANQQVGTTEIHLCAGEFILQQVGRHENNAQKGDLDIKSNLVITGHDDMTTIIDGHNLDRIFEVFPDVTLTLNNITLRGGDAHSFNGGAILNGGHLILENVNIVGNSARIGGGIFNMTGSKLDMSHSTLMQNQAALYGGGILNNNAETYIFSSILQQNISSAYGGGVTNLSGVMHINRSLLVENETGILGAGIANFHGDVIVETSTISTNTAGSVGGGVANFYGQTLQILNSTITNNDASIVGAGLYNIQPAFALSPKLSSTIVAGNNLNMDIFGSHYESLGHNLIGNIDGANIAPSIGDFFGTSAHVLSPGLLPLADNGGVTNTHALIPNSLAINNGNPFDFSADQRGFNLDLTRDIGAFELKSQQNVLQVSDVLLDLSLNTNVDLSDYHSNMQAELDSLNIDDDNLSLFFDSLPTIPQQLHAIETASELEIIML